MDRERFDALARLLGAAGSRRAVLGGIVGAAVLGTAFDVDAKKRKNRNKGKNGKKGRKGKNSQEVCFGSAACEFKDQGGQDLAECNFSGTNVFVGNNCGGCSLRASNFSNADLSGTDLRGAGLRDANLNGATLINADLQGATLSGACLTDADLTGAKTDGGSLRGALFCRTTLPDGTVSNANCTSGDSCCEVCIPLGNTCGGIVVGSCCNGGTCCDGVCVDLQSNVDNCGACLLACIAPDTCVEGACV